ncbi:type III secretion inner membrane ring lipoprotein SctJ (plasmid) [Bradyrhizobium sp. 62B]|uniref:type III secretion system inner membrane ring lipoprotein SctJ n=1 Tax=Bradyrhizobium sp. 62B TaxID=2898442 RepID=UPI002557D3F9|nr:type III secretion inner membrane ring lipoprotein SctJ [Bradyrhizobium sp. 62B]
MNDGQRVWRQAVIGAAMCLMMLILAGCAAKVELYRDLSPHEANEMLALLMRSGIDAERMADRNGTASLILAARDFPRAMSVLDNAGLPREHFTDLGTLFKKEGMISSPTDEQVRFLYGVTQELSQTLSRLDGVLSARVHAVLPEYGVGERMAAAPAKAAVLIRQKPGAGIDQQQAKIKDLVAHSLKGVSYENVAVMVVDASEELAEVSSSANVTEGNGLTSLTIGLAGVTAVSLLGSAALVLHVRRGRSRRIS